MFPIHVGEKIVARLGSAQPVLSLLDWQKILSHPLIHATYDRRQRAQNPESAMSHRSVMAASVLLVVFSSLAVVSQLLHYDRKKGVFGSSSSIVQSAIIGNDLAHISGIVERTGASSPGNGNARYLDLVLPTDARIFMTDMTGATNAGKAGYYYYTTYYLFPREVAVSLDQPRFIAEGFEGRSSESDAEILSHGFDVRIDAPNGVSQIKAFHRIPMRDPVNPSWFDSRRDIVIAFLLPFLTALMGIWLLRLLCDSMLSARMPMAEQLACGLGLGMMAVAALTLGIKLCGFHGRGWILSLIAAGALAELWRDRKTILKGIGDGFWRTVKNPTKLAIFVASLLVFLILFRLAGLQDIMEFDAVAAWLLKAKIFFLSTGHELVGWFSNPRLAYAHLDYPTLVPSLHAATYDSIGHVDEFVTKFWPTWMLLFLLAALAALSRGENSRFQAPLFFLLGVLLLPFTQIYVQMEGGTLPMVFFTVMGFVQCALGLAEKDRARIGLGLTLLFGAAMTKFEGMIFLALTAGWILLLPWARFSLKPSPRLWRTLAFCFLAALPFICLRMRIPALHFESGWTGYAVAHPGMTFSSAPMLFLIMLARLFMNPDFAKWGAGDGHVHWTGQWEGISSLYNHLTLGLAWVCLLMTIILWLAAPARRPVILWTLAVFVSALIAMSLVFASFVSISGLDHVIFERTADNTTGRYLFPMLLAWAATVVIMFFGDFHLQTSVPNGQTLPAKPLRGKKSGLETTKTQG
jgi:hypothetical protein